MTEKKTSLPMTSIVLRSLGYGFVFEVEFTLFCSTVVSSTKNMTALYAMFQRPLIILANALPLYSRCRYIQGFRIENCVYL